ncbi:hypothetical protein BXZ70DRAFT_897020 [Cristinia sonorae]|uniref:Glutaredoxin-like protein n=1 Tax=Cristinia sonorae TaxID=1940300 RepID=A0A8K0XN61_9AGAR|nr:hypothetical protein BXZ70DRAFT_897020 [Cristinia sonorae]
MSHRRTVSSRHLDMSKISLDSPPLTPPLHVLNTFASANKKSKAFWHRTTFLALFALLAVTGYIFFVAQPSFAPVAFGEANASTNGLSASQRLSQLASHARLAALRNKRPSTSAAASTGVPQVTLSTAQELAAVSSFIASLPQNVIPASVDPSKPIDPQLVLDFDTRGPHAAEEVEAMVTDTWTRNPVILFSKLHSPVSRELKVMLSEMNLLPSPVFIDVDQRADEDVLVPLILRLTTSIDLPILLIGGKTIGSVAEIRYLHAKGELQRIISRTGAQVDGGKKKKGRKH